MQLLEQQSIKHTVSFERYVLMKFYITLLASLFFTITACSESSEPTEAKVSSTPAVIMKDTLEKNWELTGLMAPESVVFDQANGVLYVSNVNGSPMDKDDNGFISKVSVTGELLILKWVEGLSAPKGLAIHNGKLYVADIDTLVEIDISNGTISNRYIAKGAKFLNDVTARDNGEVFVSDMLTNTIHRLNNGEFSVWLQDEKLENPNGLLAEKNRLVVGAWGIMTDGFATEIPGTMKAVSYENKSISNFGEGKPIGNLDGVEADNDSYLVTDWMAGKLFRINQNGNTKLLLELQQGMADHEWIASKSMVLLPMMQNNTLLAYIIK